MWVFKLDSTDWDYNIFQYIGTLTNPPHPQYTYSVQRIGRIYTNPCSISVCCDNDPVIQLKTAPYCAVE